MKASAGSAAALKAALAELQTLDRNALAQRWQAFDRPAPLRCQSGLLRGGLAWHVQWQAAKASGQAPPTRAALTQLLGGTRVPSAPPGTLLVRQWQSKTHQVQVLGDGFEYRGQRYKSLSAIARRITGTAWSGPAFFGLR